MLYIEPSVGVAPIVQVIDQARHTVDLNVYYLSSRPILDALRAAHARGVVVRVILDGRPWHISPQQVQQEARAVVETGAKLHWAPGRFEAGPGRFVYDHAKYVVTGHTVEIGTANFAYSDFHFNRDYLDITHNQNIVRAARDVFMADWTNQRAGNWPHRILVLSPGSTYKIVSIIDQPGNVEIETEEMGDDRAVLNALARKGKQAWVILPASISAADKRNASWLAAHGVHVRLMPVHPTYLHAKLICTANEAFIGSENFSYSSLGSYGNREVGVILHKASEAHRLQVQFRHDWSRSRPLP
jgi:phosphatidylserine/phosphatidylglycerophosphate/cardiolipin synthase-like enzyme